MATGYTLNAALTHNPAFTLEPIGKCSKIPTTNLHVESNQNTSFPFPSLPKSMASNTSSASNATTSGSGKVARRSTSANGTSGVLVNAVSASVLLLALAGGSLLLL
ncbi:hypothetical protein FB451DRAFT_1565817 [Mycena latifolia]|nr:hypothetical protein FB451DRAFT_1565817 [Mycena latifolia]